MRFLVLSALLVGIVSAQSLQGLPLCAYSCVENSIPASCNLDPKCICSASSFIAGVTCCVAKVCDEADQQATIKYAKGICSPAGVTLTQTAATCATSAAGAAGNNSSSSTTSMASGSSMTGSSTSSLGSSAASMVSSSVASLISSVGTTASAATSAASSAAATSKAGAEQVLAQQGVNVFAAIVAAAALL